MRGLLAGKEALKAFYARYSAFVNAFLRFITAFAAVQYRMFYAEENGGSEAP